MATQTGFDAAADAIDARITSAETNAGKAMTDVKNAIDNLQTAASAIPPSISFNAPTIGVNIPVISGVAPSAPSLTAIKASVGTKPANFSASVAERAMQSVPQEAFTVPEIVFPDAVIYSELVKPSSLAIALPDDIPDAPTVNLPTDLTVGNQTVPNIPTVSIPDWGEDIPLMDITLPETTFAYVEPIYESSLKTALASKLLDGVNNGGTGLGVTVQTAIWNQDLERLEQQKDDDIDTVLNLYSGRGFDMPTGMVAEQVQEVLKNYTRDRAQNSRTQVIEEAKIAKEMTQFFIDKGLSLEQIELSHANNVANRALEAEKAVVQFSIDLFNAKVSKFNLELEKYKAKQIEIQMRIKSQELILDAYKAELLGVDTSLKQDSVVIQNYNAQVASHGMNISLYEAELKAVESQLNIERAKVEIFKGEIGGYVAELQAQKNQSDLYIAQIAGESAKIDIHKTEVEAYATRVQAVKVSNDVVVAQINSDIAVEKLNLDSHLANVSLYKAKSDQMIAEMSAEIDVYRTSSSVFEILLKHAQAQTEFNVATQIREQTLIQANAGMALEAAKANLQAFSNVNAIRVSAASSQSQASSALAGMVGGAIQGMLQLGGQGTALETTEIAAA